MSEIIYSIYKYFTDVPYNFWAWLLLITAPLLVFIIGPEKGFWLRLSRLAVAIGLTYVFINLTLHTYRELKWKEYQICQSRFSDGEMQEHKECAHLVNIADGASNVFYLLLGWIPAGGYVCFWELLWQIYHRKKIREMGRTYKGKWFSYSFIALFLPVFLFYCVIAGTGIVFGIIKWTVFG